MGDRASESDIQFGKLVVEQGLVRAEHVEECRRLQSQLVQAGVNPVPRLGELLLKKGYLTAGDLDRTLRLASPAARPLVAGAAPPQIPEGATPGERMEKYVKSSKLGEGGMGEVWKAWDTELHRWVALKFLKGSDAEEIARFRREAQTAAKLAHPNIAAIYEARDNFIAMQFVDGRTLESYSHDDPRGLVGLLRDAAIAVHFAHEQGVIHRDLKPANLMVEKSRVYVMDFGLAKSMSVDSNLSVSGSITGTPAYMSPEQAQGSRDLDGRTDVYSLGATLYEGLAGRPPFRGAQVYEILKKVVEEDPSPLPARVSSDLRTIVMKCVEKDRGRRYATALQLAEDLSRWLSGEAILAHPPSTLYRLRKFVGRRKLVVSLAAALLFVGGLSAWFIPKWRAAAERERKEREKIELYVPIESDLNLLRMNFYRQGYALTEDEFRKYDELVEKIRHMMERTGESARGWYLIGRCREVCGDYDRAEEAYVRALEKEPAHARSLMARGRRAIEKALFKTATSRGARDRTKEFLAEAREGVAWVELGAGGVGEGEQMEADLARSYVELIVGWESGRDFTTTPMLAKWARNPHVEEFLLPEIIRSGDDWKSVTEEAVRRMPSSYAAYFWRGSRRAIAGELDGALADYSKALEINPRYFEALLNRGQLRGERHDAEGALQDYDRALALNPRSALLYSNRATVKQGRGDLDGAIADCTKALEIDPRCGAAFLNRGSARGDKGDLKGEQDDYAAALRIDPRDDAAWSIRGSALHRKGDEDGAISECTTAIEINPRCSDAYMTRGLARLEKGEVDGALADLSKAIELRPGCQAAYLNRGGVRKAKGDLDGALADYTKAIELDPRDSRAWNNRAVVRRQKGDADGAIADLTKAIELDARSALAYENRAAAREDKEDLEGALRDYDKLIELSPRSAKAHNNRGLVHWTRGEYDKAIADYTKAIELDPRHAVAYNNRGLARQAAGNSEAAIADYTQAIGIRPEYEPAWYNRGISRQKEGDLDAAIADYSKAVELRPQHAEAYANRGQAWEAMGDPAAAARDYAKALEVAPVGWPLRKRVEERLKSLRK